jgi:hypothetical protein
MRGKSDKSDSFRVWVWSSDRAVFSCDNHTPNVLDPKNLNNW